MAEMNNFGDIQESFEYITNALDSMRAQNAMNSGSMDKVLVNINSQLDKLVDMESSDLTKVFLAELKRSLDERHSFVSSKFGEIEESFNQIIKKTEDQLTAGEVKELFEIIATNLNVFSKDFSAQKELISEIDLRIEDIQKDDSQKKEVLKNISLLKQDIEKFGNGFESIILNLNDNFNQLFQGLSKLDSSESLSSLKKDIENIFLSSNAVLSTLQVIDHKNSEFEETINTFITKDDFKVEREQVAKLIVQNIELTNYINNLPTIGQFESLTEKIDTSIGIISALKNMITESGKQNQQMLTAQLDNLEAKILNISTEEEFIGFRKELAEFAQSVIQSTNLMRADLADTNSGLKNLYDFLNSMDIKNSFVNFTQITRTSENNIKESVSVAKEDVIGEIVKNKNLTKTDIEKSVLEINANLEASTNNINENAKRNLSNTVEHIQSVVNNIFSVKNALHIENTENLEIVNEKLSDLKEHVINTSNFVVQNAQENVEDVLSKIESVLEEISKVKENAEETSSKNVENIAASFQQITKKIGEIKSDLSQSSQESFENLRTIVEDFTQEMLQIKDSLDHDYQENSAEIKETIGGLSLKLNTLQEGLTKNSDVNFSEVKNLVVELTQIAQSAKASLEQISRGEASEIKNSINDFSQKLSVMEENIDIRSQSDLSKVVSLFEALSSDFNTYKDFLTESTQINFESLSVFVQNLNKKLDEVKTDFHDDLKSSFLMVKDTILTLPETIKENQVIFENEKKTLIEENTKGIQEVNERIQSLIKGILSKDNPFKEEVLFEISELKSKLDIVKEDLGQSNQELDTSVTSQINECIDNIEDLAAQYNEKYNLAISSLQNKLTEYFDAVQQISHQSDSKLNDSLREVYQIKAEVKSITEGLSVLRSDSRLSEIAEEMAHRFDSILVDIDQMEANFSSENNQSIQNLLGIIEEKFDAASQEFLIYKNSTSGNIKNIIAELDEKTENLKAQLSLTSTDIINVLSVKSDEIANKLESVNESVDKIAQINFEDAFSEIKIQLESSYFAITSAIKEDVKAGNSEQLQMISEEFDSLSEKLDKILSKVSSDNTKEIVELKSILNEKVENITSVNSLLGIVLDKLEELNSSSASTNEIISGAKAELLEKINTVEDVLIHSQDESREALLDKITEFQNRTATTVLNKVDQSKDETTSAIERIRENINSATENFYSSTQEIFSGVKEELLEKINSFEDNFLLTQDDAKAFIIDRIEESNDETKSAVYAVRENISTMADEICTSAQDIFSGIKVELLEKINSVEETFAQSKTQIKADVLNKIVDSQNNIKTLFTDKIDESQEAIFGIKDQLLGKIVSIEETFTQSKTQIKADVLNKIVDSQNNIKTLVTDKIDESQEVIFGIKGQLLEKIDSIEETLIQAKEEIKTSILDKMIENQDETNSSILEKIDEAQNKAKTEILYSLKASINDSTEDFCSSAHNMLADVKKELLERTDKFEDNLRQVQNEAKTIILEKLDDLHTETRKAVVEQIIENQENTKSEIIYGLKENLDLFSEDLKTSVQESIIEKIGNFEETIVKSKEEIKADVLNKLTESQDEVKITLMENLSTTQEDIKSSVIETINQTNDKTETIILRELEKHIEAIKEAFHSFFPDKELTEEGSQKILELQSIIQNISTDIENRVIASEENYKNATESLISDIKVSFYEKVDDSLDELKSVMDLIDNKTDVIPVLDELRTEIFDKFSDITDVFHESIESISVKSELEELGQQIGGSIDALFDNIKEELSFAIENSSVLTNISEKSEEIERRIENLKNVISDEISEKLDKFELGFDNQKIDISATLEDLKSFLSEFKESYTELSLNTMMEISGFLSTVQEKIDNIYETLHGNVVGEKLQNIEEKLNNIGLDERFGGITAKLDGLNFDDKFEDIQTKLDDLNLNDKINEIQTKLEGLSLDGVSLDGKLEDIQSVLDVMKEPDFVEVINAIDKSKTDVKEELSVLNQKLDALVMESDLGIETDVKSEIAIISEKLDSLVLGSNSEIENDIKEIKRIITSQVNLFDKVDKFEEIGKLEESGDLSGLKTEVQGILKRFEAKLDTWSVNKQEGSTENIKNELDSFKEEFLESLVSLFTQISFEVEAEDIKDFVNEKAEEIKSLINRNLSGIGNFKKDFGDITNISIDEDLKHNIESNFDNVLSSLDMLHDKANDVGSSCSYIQSDINEVKEHILSLQNSLDNDSEYSYTLQDVESDIAKLRLVLKELSETKSIGGIEIPNLDKLGNLNKLNEDIISISTRTNKILLNSDESYAALKANLDDLKNVVSNFERKVKNLDNKEPIIKLDQKIEKLNNLTLSCVQSDKIFNQTFMYLAEWIDKADSNIASIKQNMVKTTDIERLLDRFSKKFDRQEEKIKSLEAKIEKLTKSTVKPSKETDIKTIIKEVLSKVPAPEAKVDLKLAKKVDGIDRQLATLGKNIEKITSYVD